MWNNFLLPALTITDLESFNDGLWEITKNDWNRPHSQKQTLISELYKEDQARFLHLPAKAFECVRYEEVKADKYALFMWIIIFIPLHHGLPNKRFWQISHKTKLLY